MKRSLRHTLFVLVGIAALAACSDKAPPAGAPAGTPDSTLNAPATTPEAGGTSGTVATETGESNTEQSLDSLSPLPAAAQLPGGKWQAGRNYQPIVPAQPTSVDAGKVEVVEVFWYACGHCYALDPFLENWKTKSKPSYVEFTRLPVMWGPVHKAHAKFFYTLEALGKEASLHTKVLDEVHQRGNMLAVQNDDAATLKLMVSFAKANGISEQEFMGAWNSMSVDSKLRRAEELTLRYQVTGVPLMIVNGKYRTDVGMAGGHEQLLALLNDLAASEKPR